jgi:hypothetical protein
MDQPNVAPSARGGKLPDPQSVDCESAGRLRLAQVDGLKDGGVDDGRRSMLIEGRINGRRVGKVGAVASECNAATAGV